MDDRIEKIKVCEERIRELSISEENKRRASMWKDDDIWPPKPKGKEAIPFTFDIERIGLAKILGYSLIKFYTDPIEYVLRTMEAAIYIFEEYRDCTPIAPSVSYWAGVGFEFSLFGMPTLYTEEDTWIGREHLLKERVPVGNLEIPDFYENQAMKDAFYFCEKMRDVMSDDFELGFPQWDRSAWGMAWQLRGIENLIFDYMEDPGWVDDFLGFLNAARFRWSDARAGMLGIDLQKINLFNDEVGTPVVSPGFYEDVIFKTEKDASEHFGGINYWHSCGNTTLLIPLINKVPAVEMIHVSPWTDRNAAAAGYAEDRALQIVLHPVSEVICPESEDARRQVLLDIKRIFKERPITVRADGFEIMYSVERDTEQMKKWVETANEVLIES